MLAVSKILGVIVLVMPKFPLLKEWAYAGFFIMMSGAVTSHIAIGDPISETFPSLLLLVLTILSWYFRPPSRKLTLVNQ
jgi:VIT1/CCC1 family predicted Fe2+/Mn2+ transporter